MSIDSADESVAIFSITTSRRSSYGFPEAQRLPEIHKQGGRSRKEMTASCALLANPTGRRNAEEQGKQARPESLNFGEGITVRWPEITRRAAAGPQGVTTAARIILQTPDQLAWSGRRAGS